MSVIRYYSTNWCGFCESEFPKVERIASKLGYTIERINVEQCPIRLKQKCESIDAVPVVELNGKIMTVSELEKLNP
jgi:thiol-disulfide isomerase/thioredoxin